MTVLGHQRVRIMSGNTEWGMSRRRVLAAIGSVASVGVAGCASGGAEDTTTRPSTETSTTTTTERTTSTTTKTTTTTARETVEDLRARRESLTDADLRERYRAGIPDTSYFDLDYDRVQRENDTRRAQLIDITATVGDKYEDYVEGNHAVMHAIHGLPWMGWDQDNIVNIVTRYNSAPMEQITVNYSTGDGGRHLDGTIASDSISGEETYIENIPDSGLMDGNQGNLLVTDMESNREVSDGFSEEDWRGLQLSMQSVVPGLKGPSNFDERVRDRNIIFDGDAMNYVGEHYDDSAEAVGDVSEEALEIGMSTVPVRSSGRYVGVTAGNDGLEVDGIYAEEEGKAKLREPIEL